MNFIINLALFIVQRIYNRVPCGKPCGQTRAQQVDDQAEKESQAKHRRTEQHRHAQVEVTGSTDVLTIGEQPRTHSIHSQIAEYQPYDSAYQRQHKVLVQYLPYQYAARRPECLPHSRPVR